MQPADLGDRNDFALRRRFNVPRRGRVAVKGQVRSRVVIVSTEGKTLRAGTAQVDITPRKFPVLVCGGFLSRPASRVNDPLFARCLVLDLIGESTWEAHAGRNMVGFGSLSFAATGEAWWDYMTWSAEQPEVEVYAQAEHHIVYKHEDVYACFPSLHRYGDDTLVSSFGTRVRRSHIDNTGGATRMVSRDGGVMWEKADASVSHYNPDAVRADSHLAIANAIGWRYGEQGKMERLKAEGRTVRAVRPGTVAGLSGPAPSIRLKRIREALEDFEYMTLPSKQGHQAQVDKNVGSLARSFTDWSQSPETYLAARTKLATLIVAE